MQPTEWNFLGLKKAEIDKACLWEYGRECRPLIEQIKRLRDAVGQHYDASSDAEVALLTYQEIPFKKFNVLAEWTHKHPPLASRHDDAVLRDKIEPILDEITRVVPRFNWGLFCSHEFPDLPWLGKGSTCPITKQHKIWPESIVAGGTMITFNCKRLASKKGEQDRNDISSHKSLPYVHSFRAELIACEGGTFNMNALIESVAEILPEDSQTGDAIPLHFFVIPDEDFLLYDKSHLSDAIKRHLNRLDRRKIFPDPLQLKDRKNEWRAYLNALGVMRLLNGYSRPQLRNFVADVDDKTIDKLQLHDIDKLIESRRVVLPAFQGLFNVPADEVPIRWNRYRSRRKASGR